MLLQRFQQRLQQFHVQPAQTKFLIAVSGGIDSITLTDLVYKSGFDFIIAHCNFQLRGAESERDEVFVTALEQKYSKQVLVKKFTTESYASANKLSIQEAARILRYAWFETLLQKQPATDSFKLLTAHNANDTIETMLMHFFRGTGIQGLTGIPETDTARNILRPLLFAKREEIVAYAKEQQLNWVEDSSNTSDKYTRNFFRLQLLPAIHDIYPNVEDNLLSNLVRFKETAALYQQSVTLHKSKLTEQKGNEIHIPVLKLIKAIPLHTIIWEIIKNFHFTAAQTNEVIKLLHADNGSYISSATHRIIRNRSWLIIAPLETATAATILIEQSDTKIVFENGSILLQQAEKSPDTIPGSSHIALLDTAGLQFPLLLRRWKQGDYFYPLGMQKKKKLSKFFIDQKLSKTDKEKVWVLECDKKIIWVVGYRIDNRFKITDDSKTALHITYTPA